MLRAALRKLMGSDLAIDLGTAFTRVFLAGRGVAVERASVVASIGDAQSHPLRSGVIADVGGAAELVAHAIRSSGGASLRHPRVLACIPTDATDDERRALRQAVRAAGASEAAIIPEPLAAAVGAGMDMSSEYAQLLVDFGEGVTDAAVVRSGQLIVTRGIRIGCSDVRQAVESGIAARYGAVLSDQEAERLVRHGCDDGLPDDAPVCLHGPAGPIVVRREELLETCRPVLEQIADFVSRVFFELPDRVAAEVVESGLLATGGGALNARLIELLSLQTGLLVRPAADPLRSVIRGAGKIVSAPGWRSLLGETA